MWSALYVKNFLAEEAQSEKGGKYFHIRIISLNKKTLITQNAQRIYIPFSKAQRLALGGHMLLRKQ